MMPCVFCNLQESTYIAENELFFAVWDLRPVSKGHALIISKRHCSNYFELDSAEASALQEISKTVKLFVEEKHAPQGFNLAMNCGIAANQTIFHFHLHLIPRYSSDGKNANKRMRESLL
ncbi:MAG: HIT family protein [Candidatus Cloacimonetes bacterium]|nr:HIT family protein [Candidatus Cloacimonadota bacterium]